jgi:uncharacterized protein (TIGR03435 family)
VSGVLRIFVASLFFATLFAQDVAPRFEVATLKVNASGDFRQLVQMQPGGRITLTNIPARQLIVAAYQVTPFQLVGGPVWLATDRYDIVAKLEGEPKPLVPGQPSPQVLALRPLLADRFKLKLHKETREMEVYNLVLIKRGVPGPTMNASTTDCAAIAAARRGGPPPGPPDPNAPVQCGMMGFPGMIRSGAQPIASITQMLTNQTGRLVFDRTNLTGNWDFTLKFAEEARGVPPPGVTVPPVDPDAPSLFTALQEQLGMKLESTKAPVEVTVIDSAEHPTED